MKGGKMKRISPIEGILSTVSAIKDLALGKPSPSRENAMNSKVGKIVIDTCCAFDTHRWETGIQLNKKDTDWVIVEQYESRKKAEKGHAKWTNEIKKNPNIKLKDINVWGL
jgi:hypothetical protein